MNLQHLVVRAKSFFLLMVVLLYSVPPCSAVYFPKNNIAASAVTVADTIDHTYSGSPRSTESAHRHLAFFKQVRLARDAWRLHRHMARKNDNNNNGLVSVIASGIGLLAFLGAVALAGAAASAAVMISLIALYLGGGAVGIIFGASGMKHDKRHNMALTGMITGIVELGIVIVALAITVIITAFFL